MCQNLSILDFTSSKRRLWLRRLSEIIFFGNGSTINTAGKQNIYYVSNMEIEKCFILKTSFQAIKIRAII